MADLFAPALQPQEGPSGEVNFTGGVIRFGDGYSAPAARGLNTRFQVWPLTWVGTITELQPIRDFFDAHGDHESFLFTPPYGTQGLYRLVSKYQFIPEAANNGKVMATLEEVFYP